MQFDLPLEQLREYRGGSPEPDDFDAFWQGSIAEAQQIDLDPRLEPWPTRLQLIDVYDVSFRGYDGHRIRAWLKVPAGTTRPLPTVIEFAGYGGGRGAAEDNLFWSNAGLAHMQVDTRGQGSAWTVGSTSDPVGSEPHYPGFMTQGIGSPATYYYRRVFIDSLRSLQAARCLPLTDTDRIGLLGSSQGGGIALAVAGLDSDVAAVASRVPFLCDFPRALSLASHDPYNEVVAYLATRRQSVRDVTATLAYFDGVSFAARAKAPVQMSVALMDTVCPPSTVFAAFNAYAGPKALTVWPFNGHEGGGIDDNSIALDRFTEQFEMGRS